MPSMQTLPLLRVLIASVPVLVVPKSMMLMTSRWAVVVAFRLICLISLPFQYTPTVPHPLHLVATRVSLPRFDGQG